MTPQPTGKEGPFWMKRYRHDSDFYVITPGNRVLDFTPYKTATQAILGRENGRLAFWLKSPQGRAWLRGNGVI